MTMTSAVAISIQAVSPLSIGGAVAVRGEGQAGQGHGQKQAAHESTDRSTSHLVLHSELVWGEATSGRCRGRDPGGRRNLCDSVAGRVRNGGGQPKT